jgi:hypothetical protein
MRIFGPDKSAMMATGRPAAFDAARMFSMFCRCAEELPVRKVQARDIHADADHLLKDRWRV